MGRNDESKKLFWEDDERFVNLINTVFGHGRELISAAALQEKSEALHAGNIDGKVKETQKYRDVIRKVFNGTLLFLIGIENQEKIHYAMPVRAMLMDAMEYDSQLRKRRRIHRNRRNLKPGAEFLSGLTYNERLAPVCTITLYYGKEPWDGPQDLHSLLDLQNVPKAMQELIPNYPLSLIEIYRSPDWENFRSDLREVFGFIQCSENMKKMQDFLDKNHEKFTSLSKETVDFLAYTTGISSLTKISKNEQEGYNMCKAIDDMLMESRKKGIATGKKAGIRAGKKMGIKAGRMDKLLSQIKVNNPAASNGASNLQRCKQRGIKLAALQSSGVCDPRGIRQMLVQARRLAHCSRELNSQRENLSM